jgi:hypothetical protein
LIIDQLEEVFTLAEQQEAEVSELFAQIEDLVENRAPVALQKTLDIRNGNSGLLPLD